MPYCSMLWEGQRTGVWTIHSLVLCLFAGPIGLLSHILTTWLTQKQAAVPLDATDIPATEFTLNPGQPAETGE